MGFVSACQERGRTPLECFDDYVSAEMQRLRSVYGDTMRAVLEGLERIAREMRESIRRETSPEVAWELVDKFDQLVLSTMTR